MAIQINKFSTKSSETLPCYDTAGGNESRAYLYVEVEDREMWISYKLGHDNSWSVREDRRYVHTFRVANNLTAEGYNDLLSRPWLAYLVEQLIDECEEYYDGNNYKMRVSERGQEVIEAIERYCEDTSDCESLDPWCADMYLQEGTYEALTANGGTHEEIAERIVVEARKNGIHLSAVDVENRLDEMQEEVEVQGVTTKYCILTTDDSVGYWTGDTEPEIGAKVTLCVPTENGATQWEAKVVKEILESEKLES